MTQHPIDPAHIHAPDAPRDPYAEPRATYPGQAASRNENRRLNPTVPSPSNHRPTDGTAYVLPPQPPVHAEAPAPTYSCDLPPSRMIMSLTGFDEIAIAVRFGQKIGELREDAVTAGRALAFVHMRRLGAKDPEAYEQSMSMTMQEVVDYFAPEPKGDDTQLEDAGPVSGGVIYHPDRTTSAEGN